MSRAIVAIAVVCFGSSAQALELFSAGTPDFQIFSVNYTYTTTGTNGAGDTTATLAFTTSGTAGSAADFDNGDLTDTDAQDSSAFINQFGLGSFTVNVVETIGGLVLDATAPSTFQIFGFSTLWSLTAATPLLSGSIDEMLITDNTALRLSSVDAVGQLFGAGLSPAPFAGDLGFIIQPGGGATFNFVNGGSGSVSLDATTPTIVPVAGSLPLILLPLLGYFALHKRRVMTV